MTVWMPAASSVVRRVSCLAVKWAAVMAGSMDAVPAAKMAEYLV